MVGNLIEEKMSSTWDIMGAVRTRKHSTTAPVTAFISCGKVMKMGRHQGRDQMVNGLRQLGGVRHVLRYIRDPSGSTISEFKQTSEC